MVSMIAAMAHQRVIGIENQLPWHLPNDFIWFKKVTMGKPIIMGRQTFDSIGKPLPGRQNIVISTNPALQIPGCNVVNSPEAAIALVADEPEVMVIGGAVIYKLFMPMADRLYLTQVDAEIEGDAWFPDYESAADWELVFEESHQPDARHAYGYTFQQFDRRVSSKPGLKPK